jgi:hypothetical protein
MRFIVTNIFGALTLAINGRTEKGKEERTAEGKYQRVIDLSNFAKQKGLNRLYYTEILA